MLDCFTSEGKGLGLLTSTDTKESTRTWTLTVRDFESRWRSDLLFFILGKIRFDASLYSNHVWMG